MTKAPQFISDYSQAGQSSADGRLDAPAFHRNHDPIWTVLKPFLAEKSGEALEVGSGTGQHVVAFARESLEISWVPSDHLDAHLQSINAWRRDCGLSNIMEPQRSDLSDPAWASKFDPDRFLAIVCINVLHIAPWHVSENLIGGAARLLRADGRLFVYGPFKRDGQHTAPSNAAFDASLRASNPDWGVRDASDLGRLAERSGLKLSESVEMPANNFTLVFERLR